MLGRTEIAKLEKRLADAQAADVGDADTIEALKATIATSEQAAHDLAAQEARGEIGADDATSRGLELGDTIAKSQLLVAQRERVIGERRAVIAGLKRELAGAVYEPALATATREDAAFDRALEAFASKVGELDAYRRALDEQRARRATAYAQAEELRPDDDERRAPRLSSLSLANDPSILVKMLEDAHVVHRAQERARVAERNRPSPEQIAVAAIRNAADADARFPDQFLAEHGVSVSEIAKLRPDLQPAARERLKKLRAEARARVNPDASAFTRLPR